MEREGGKQQQKQNLKLIFLFVVKLFLKKSKNLFFFCLSTRPNQFYALQTIRIYRNLKNIKPNFSLFSYLPRCLYRLWKQKKRKKKRNVHSNHVMALYRKMFEAFQLFIVLLHQHQHPFSNTIECFGVAKKKKKKYSTSLNHNNRYLLSINEIKL